MYPRLTAHAQTRVGQRGISSAALGTLLQHFDRETSVGGDCRALRISRSAIASLQAEAPEARVMHGLDKLVVIESCSTGNIVTVLRDHGHPRHRHYRKLQ